MARTWETPGREFHARIFTGSTFGNVSFASVRFRACQIIAGVFSHAGADLELSDDVIEDVSRAMRLRLRDKVPQVRAQAARALARLQDPGERRDFSADPVTQAYRDMVGSDRNKDVRKVVLASMAVSEFTLPDILVHTRENFPAG